VASDAGKDRMAVDLQKITAAAKNLLALFESTSFPAQMDLGPKASRTGFASRAILGKDHELLDPSDDKIRTGSILIADDNEMNRDMLSRRLERQGYTVAEVENGFEAMELLRARKFDLVLLDVIMPGLDGYETLKLLMDDPGLRHIPVIMLSALDEVENVVRCIEIGAEDYVTKPFNPILLNARIIASMEKKRLRDKEQDYVEILQIEREKSERLLLNVLPRSIAERIKRGETTIADVFPNATVLFADLVDFTQVTTRLSPKETVEVLNDIFSQFDWLAELHGVEKIKTIADTYVVVGGVPTPRVDHAAAVAEMALEMQKVIARFTTKTGYTFSLRIGISSGPVIAGVIGRKKFIYDLWGDTVKVSGLMEANCNPGTIRVSASSYEKLRDKYQFQPAGKLDLRGIGQTETYLLCDRSTRAPAGLSGEE
jgi:class 3 adenylate cyclase